ncbi:hypothetical protein CR513_27730, partial [Mucuna pruriens]
MIHDGVTNRFSFEHMGQKVTLKSLSLRENKKKKKFLRRLRKKKVRKSDIKENPKEKIVKRNNAVSEKKDGTKEAVKKRKVLQENKGEVKKKEVVKELGSDIHVKEAFGSLHVAFNSYGHHGMLMHACGGYKLILRATFRYIRKKHVESLDNMPFWTAPWPLYMTGPLDGTWVLWTHYRS